MNRYIAGILINVVGFAGAVGTDVPEGAMYVYNLNFFTGFIVSSGVYWILCKLSPIPATCDHWLEVDDDVTGRSNSLVYGADSSDPESAYEPADEYRGVSATKY